MINDKNTNPQRDLYYLGGVVIDALHQASNDDGFFDIFEKVRERETISMNLFSLTIDWLYLLDAVKIKNGRLEKCF
jgi:hypothetical protein